MIYLGVLGLFVLTCLAIGAIALERERRGLITDLREANRKLYADNQALTQALCAANGQRVDLNVGGALISGGIVPRPVMQPPYFASKRPTFET